VLGEEFTRGPSEPEKRSGKVEAVVALVVVTIPVQRKPHQGKSHPLVVVAVAVDGESQGLDPQPPSNHPTNQLGPGHATKQLAVQLRVVIAS